MSNTIENNVTLIYSIVRMAAATGRVGKGLLECSTSIQKRDAKLLVIAEDVDPKKLTDWLCRACIQKNVPYAVVPSKRELGSCVGIPVSATSVVINDPGEAADDLTWVLSRHAAIQLHSAMSSSDTEGLLSALVSTREEIARLEPLLASAHPNLPDQRAIERILGNLLVCVAAVATHSKVDLRDIQPGLSYSIADS